MCSHICSVVLRCEILLHCVRAPSQRRVRSFSVVCCVLLSGVHPTSPRSGAFRTPQRDNDHTVGSISCVLFVSTCSCSFFFVCVCVVLFCLHIFLCVLLCILLSFSFCVCVCLSFILHGASLLRRRRRLLVCNSPQHSAGLMIASMQTIASIGREFVDWLCPFLISSSSSSSLLLLLFLLLLHLFVHSPPHHQCIEGQCISWWCTHLQNVETTGYWTCPR